MQGWTIRQEDTHISEISQGAEKNIDIFGIFDGHNGNEISRFVSYHFMKELINNENFKKGNLQQSFRENFIRMDEIMQTQEGIEEIKTLARKSKKEDQEQLKKQPQDQISHITPLIEKKDTESNKIIMDSGCTACVLCIDEKNRKLYYINAGISRIVNFKNGTAFAKTVDHRPDLESEKTRIYKADGWVESERVNGNLNISRMFGNISYKQNKNLKPEQQIITANPDIVVEDLKKDVDFIIIASDGIWDCLSNQEVCDFVAKKFKENKDIKISGIIEEIMDNIIDKTLSMTDFSYFGKDNMTCIVIVPKK